MALRSTSYWRSVLSGKAATYATSTAPKMQAYAPAADVGGQVRQCKPKPAVKGDRVPVYVAVGMIALSVSLGLHTAMLQLRHSPTVRVNKKKRETLPEVEEPEEVAKEAEQFINKSLLRKVAHIKEHDGHDHKHLLVPDFSHKDPHFQTLKSVGVDPKAKLS